MSTKLYLIPTLLGSEDYTNSIPENNLKILREIQIFIVENEKSARRFIKTVLPDKKQSELEIHILNKDTKEFELSELTALFKRNEPIGILSEAGLPAVADPGAKLVKLAHQKNVRVIPLVGPSSIMLALMSSGMNGQKFKFHGYLPIDKNERRKAIIDLETESKKEKMTQIFIETPYRNNQLLADLIKYCHPATLICVAADVTTASEIIISCTAKKWLKKTADFHKKPAVFLLESF